MLYQILLQNDFFVSDARADASKDVLRNIYPTLMKGFVLVENLLVKERNKSTKFTKLFIIL